MTDNLFSKTFLTKDEILATGDWYEADYNSIMEGYFWKHKSLLNNQYTFYMRRHNDDGFTTITEEGHNRDDIRLFDGYIKNLDELKQIVHLCRLHEL